MALTMRRRDLLAALGAALVLPPSARAAEHAELVPQPGRWRDWHQDLAMANLVCPDAGERKRFLDNATAYSSTFRTHPTLASPRGFDVMPVRGIRGDSLHEKPPHPIPGSLEFYTFWYFRGRDGQVLCGDEASLVLNVIFNTLHPLWRHPVAEDEHGSMFWAPETVPSHSGVPRFAGGHLLTRRTEPPFVAAPVRRVLAAWLAAQRHEQRNRPGDAFVAREADRLAAQLAALTPEEGAAPAWVVNDYNRILGKPGQKDAFAVLAENPAFYDRSLPRTALQSAVVQPFERNLSWDVPAVKAAREALGKQAWPKLVAALS